MSAREHGNWEIKDLIDGYLEELPDYDSYLLQLIQLKVDMKHLVADVDCIDTDGENINGSGSRLFKKAGQLSAFRSCNERAIKCYGESKQLEASVEKLLGGGDMASWFRSQTEFLRLTLEEGFFNLIYDLREKEMEEMAAGRRTQLTGWAVSTLPKKYCR